MSISEPQHGLPPDAGAVYRTLVRNGPLALELAESLSDLWERARRQRDYLEVLQTEDGPTGADSDVASPPSR